MRELTPDGYATDPDVRAEVDELCRRADVELSAVCRIDIDEQRAVFYRWSDLPPIVEGEPVPPRMCEPVYLCELPAP